jgi:hypothetical protein
LASSPVLAKGLASPGLSANGKNRGSLPPWRAGGGPADSDDVRR